MEQTSGNMYFTKTKNQAKIYPYLNKDITTDILTIGGGIDGAIANYYLSQKYKCVLVDKSRFGYCCTAAATALLEYQLDDFAETLSKYMTSEEITSIYRAGLSSIERLKEFVKLHSNKCEFKVKDTLVYSDKEKDIDSFKKEFDFRKTANLDVAICEQNDFPFQIACGLFCKNGGAEANPYLLAKQFIENAKNQNSLFENTNIVSITKKDDLFIATTNFGNQITCKKIVAATGFDHSLFTQDKIFDKFVTYTIITNPLPDLTWKSRALVQDFGKPYHYCRLLPDGRVIFGGEDTIYKNKPIDKKLAKKKYLVLESQLKKLIPEQADQIKVEHEYCGIFAQTKNNLGMIGEYTQENIFYFFSCGANGIINALFGIDTLIASIEGKQTPLSHLFSPKRLLQ